MANQLEHLFFNLFTVGGRILRLLRLALNREASLGFLPIFTATLALSNRLATRADDIVVFLNRLNFYYSFTRLYTPTKYLIEAWEVVDCIQQDILAILLLVLVVLFDG